jgi:hypothetical protein
MQCSLDVVDAMHSHETGTTNARATTICRSGNDRQNVFVQMQAFYWLEYKGCMVDQRVGAMAIAPYSFERVAQMLVSLVNMRV